MLKVKTIENPMYKNHCPVPSACGSAYIVNHKQINKFSRDRTSAKENCDNRERKISLTKKGYDEVDEMLGALDC